MDLPQFKELADMPPQIGRAQSGGAQGAPRPDPSVADHSQPPAIYEVSDEGYEAHILETWYTELREEKKGLLPPTHYALYPHELYQIIARVLRLPSKRSSKATCRPGVALSSTTWR